MLEPRWRSGGMLPGDSNRDRVTLDQERSCLMPMPNLPGETGMTFFPITKGKGALLCFTPFHGEILMDLFIYIIVSFLALLQKNW